ncbi:MAG: protein-export membrane protein SecF [Candidatus Zambryskibacteria bacterium RIFCSPHIGHO2_02_FULL_43_14]|uniref:Protein-export membrane protein SecF n=1 Tax=Candidatus Zambryskibacteria bacterium RIFCSPHIGHO2_02_FULL_43_14 TaxID=1802748 RepID=A0A1G2TGV9_9BACT|nr:MAG: protein-export membrane protein SecF [Candidatus Zambryskibacteria bacterium RIFCSPHIGHO2_01_FULL_43_60]OHA96278.1 MAG: protein-export membrane protein SecF [Candidatus Zambryskibacteria bacterium RIFCSPHIGHO2_02_FULL_43_14]OHB04159.1 MAG: protein-export membrane protein SecF [Candidatus Zambryskibacteria bacterium RIFCSPLOWO2_01_FULL_42_41]
MFVVHYRKIFFLVSGILLLVSIAAMFVYDFRTSIDFKGGTLTEVKFSERPAQTETELKIEALNMGGFSVRPSGDFNYTIRTKELSLDERQELIQTLGNPVVERQNTIGPIAGAELKSKAVKAVGVVMLMIVLFITFAFRKVSRPVSSWKYGLATIIALAHDVVIPTGIFVILGHYIGIEIDLLFVTGLLAILGYSVHDTIVVFDRVRENLHVNAEGNMKEEFETTVGKSVAQTFGRSINTSLTIFITLLALFLVGSPATKDFALLLIIGVIIGTYSSIFVASPLLVTFYKWQKK